MWYLWSVLLCFAITPMFRAIICQKALVCCISQMILQKLADAKGYGCDAIRLDDLEEIKKAAVQAWTKSKSTVLEIPISPKYSPLI